MADKLFNEYYTKNFELPVCFTALNGAIQYFELATGVDLVVEPASEDASDAVKAEKATEIQAAQANYLRILEVLRSAGAQPIITSVAEQDLSFTLEQTWVYGNHAKAQVSEHYAAGKVTEDTKWEGLSADAKSAIESLFNGKHIGKFVKYNAGTEEKPEWAIKEDGEFSVTATVKTTAGSLNANHA